MTSTSRPSIGLVPPTIRTGASIEGTEAAADAASRVRWTGVWVPDHVLIDSASADQHGTILDAILSLADVAARHPSLRVGTALVLMRMLNAVILAKEPGCTSASDAAGVPPNTRPSRQRVGSNERSAYRDEAIDLWKHLRSGAWRGVRPPNEQRAVLRRATDHRPRSGFPTPGPGAARRSSRAHGSGRGMERLTIRARLAQRRQILAR